jgi:hypothetical protein
MTAANNFTFFGNRSKTRQDCEYGVFGGYIAEKVQVHGSIGKPDVRTIHAQRQ